MTVKEKFFHVTVLSNFARGFDKYSRGYHHKTIVDLTGNEIYVEAASQYDSVSQILNFTLFYLRNGELTRTKKVNMRCFFPEELMALCRFNGLEVMRRYGDYDETPFTSNSPKQILFCRKTSETKVLT